MIICHLKYKNKIELNRKLKIKSKPLRISMTYSLVFSNSMTFIYIKTDTNHTPNGRIRVKIFFSCSLGQYWGLNVFLFHFAEIYFQRFYLKMAAEIVVVVYQLLIIRIFYCHLKHDNRIKYNKQKMKKQHLKPYDLLPFDFQRSDFYLYKI